MTDKQHANYYLRAWYRCRAANHWVMREKRLVATDPRESQGKFILELLLVWSAAGFIAKQKHRGISPEELRHGCHVVALKRDKSSKTFTNKEVGRVVSLFDLLAAPDSVEARRRWEFPDEVAREDTLAHIRRLAPEAYIRGIILPMHKTTRLEALDLDQLYWLRRTLIGRRGKQQLAPEFHQPTPSTRTINDI